MIRKIVKDKVKLAGIDKIEIEKNNNNYRIFIKVAKPGLVIGRGGKGVDDLRKVIETELIKLFKERKVKTDFSISLNIEELKRNKKPILCALIFSLLVEGARIFIPESTKNMLLYALNDEYLIGHVFPYLAEILSAGVVIITGLVILRFAS